MVRNGTKHVEWETYALLLGKVLNESTDQDEQSGSEENSRRGVQITVAILLIGIETNILWVDLWRQEMAVCQLTSMIHYSQNGQVHRSWTDFDNVWETQLWLPYVVGHVFGSAWFRRASIPIRMAVLSQASYFNAFEQYNEYKDDDDDEGRAVKPQERIDRDDFLLSRAMLHSSWPSDASFE